MSSKTLLSYGDCLLKEEDLLILKEDLWLNDTLINFAFEYMTDTIITKDGEDSQISMCCAEVVQLIKMSQSIGEIANILEDLDLPSQEWIFLPINDNDSQELAGGDHWSLLVYSKGMKSFYHFDSLHHGNYSIASGIAQKLSQLLHDSKTCEIIIGESPTQENGYDCGMYVIEMSSVLINEITSGQSISASNKVKEITCEQVALSRQCWADTITKLALKQTNPTQT